MAQINESLKEMLQSLKQDRDELRVKVELAKMEAREDWQEVEEKWHNFEQKIKGVGEESIHSAEKIGQEISEAYQRIRKTLK